MFPRLLEAQGTGCHATHFDFGCTKHTLLLTASCAKSPGLRRRSRRPPTRAGADIAAGATAAPWQASCFAPIRLDRRVLGASALMPQGADGARWCGRAVRPADPRGASASLFVGGAEWQRDRRDAVGSTRRRVRGEGRRAQRVPYAARRRRSGGKVGTWAPATLRLGLAPHVRGAGRRSRCPVTAGRPTAPHRLVRAGHPRVWPPVSGCPRHWPPNPASAGRGGRRRTASGFVGAGCRSVGPSPGIRSGGHKTQWAPSW